MWEALFVAAATLSVALIAFYLNSFFLRPVFNIDEDESKSVDVIRDRDNLRHYRLTVRNEGFRAAHNCVGTLSIKAISRNDVLDVGYGGTGAPVLRQHGFNDQSQDLQPEAVLWATGMLERHPVITINKWGQARLLLFFAQEDNPEGIFVEPSYERYFRITLKAHRTYKGEIVITSDNANTRRVSFSIEADEKREPVLRIEKVMPRTKPRIIRQLWIGQ